jgi:hypothetical protein
METDEEKDEQTAKKEKIEEEYAADIEVFDEKISKAEDDNLE